MKHISNSSFIQWNFAAIAVAVIPLSVQAATVDTACGKISVEDHCVTLPGVQSVSAATTPLAGQQVTVQCVYTGSGNKVIDHPGTPADKAWHSNSAQFPFEIRAGGVIILKKNIAAPTAGGKYTETAPWIPGPQHAGKSVALECIVDPTGAIQKSFKQAMVNVLAKPIPRLNIKDQPPAAAMPIPGGPKLPPAAGSGQSGTGRANVPAMNVRQLPPPDLVVSATYLIQPCAVEGKYSRLKLQATVKNQGKGPASVTSGWGIAVTAYPNVALVVPAQYKMKPVAHGPMTLKPGASFNADLEVVIGPQKNNQGYGIVVQVDPDSAVKETNEFNNTIIGVNVPALKNYCTAQ